MRPWAWSTLAIGMMLLTGCGFALQRASVSRNFKGRFGCPTKKVERVSDGYRVEGCGRRAEYVCVTDPEPGGQHRYDPDDSAGQALAAVFFAALMAGTDQHCRLAYSEPLATTPMPVASSAPAPVRRITTPQKGEIVLKTRVLFAGGHLSARAKPSEHAEHALLIVHGTARLPVGTCRAEIFHDGVAVPVVDQLRPDAYEVQLLVPIRALMGVERAVRFAGSVCGLHFDLDASSRATLGLFAVHFQEQLTRLGGMSAGTLVPAAAQ